MFERFALAARNRLIVTADGCWHHGFIEQIQRRCHLGTSLPQFFGCVGELFFAGACTLRFAGLRCIGLFCQHLTNGLIHARVLLLPRHNADQCIAASGFVFASCSHGLIAGFALGLNQFLEVLDHGEKQPPQRFDFFLGGFRCWQWVFAAIEFDLALCQ